MLIKNALKIDQKWGRGPFLESYESDLRNNLVPERLQNRFVNHSGRIWTDLASFLEVQIHPKTVKKLHVF